MQIKLNIPLIGKITGIFDKAGLPERKPRREDTTETSRTLAWYYYKQLQIERTRLARYGDYRLMDEDYVEICSFLDIYADYATKDLGESGDAFEIFSESKKAQNILDELVKRTKLQEALWDTARNLVHMGDEFDEVIIGGQKWIERLKKLEPEQMKYDIDEYGLPREEPIIQIDPMSSSKIVGFKPWQIVHWKLGGTKRKYGTSILKPIRRVYKQLQMIEDGMVISRLTRAHLRFLFLVDVEGMSPEEGEDHLKKVIEDTKKKRMVNLYTGQLETEQNPLSQQEDFYMTTRKDSNAGVQVLQGAMNLGNIRDVEYIQNKLFVGLGPKSLLGIGGDIEAKATTMEQMINFARRVGRIRKALRAGINQIGNYQLTLLGEVPHPGLYDIKFAPMSMVDELRKWTMEKLKAEVAQIYRMGAGVPLTDEYILKNFVGVADEDIPELLGAPKPEPAAKSAGGNGNLALRQGGLTGVTTPSTTGMNPKKSTQEGYEGNGFHMATLQLMNLVETMRDLVCLELNR